MPSRRSQIEMEASADHLRRQGLRAWALASLPLAGGHLMTVDWAHEPADAAFGIGVGAAAGASLTVIALLAGLALRLPTRDSARVTLACRLLAAAGLLAATIALAANASAPTDALGTSELRHPALLHAGALALAFAMANLPRPRRDAPPA
jgi:hypothetical protein